MSIFIVNLHFLEPYRIVEYAGKEGIRLQSKKRFERGPSFAQWVEWRDRKVWQPRITGTLFVPLLFLLPRRYWASQVEIGIIINAAMENSI